MSWKSTKEKERFFEDLDKAFNTPATQELVLPKLEKRIASETRTSIVTPEPKRQKTNDTSEVQQRRSSSTVTALQSTTDVDICPSKSNNPKPRRTSSTRKKSLTETSEQKSDSKDPQAKEPGLLDGMVLYFIPNSKKHAVRRFRMTLFAQHGADVRHEWSEEITHIICDKSVTGERVLRDLRWEQFPTGVTIINEDWVPECLAVRKMIDMTKERFRVPGVQSQTTNESGPSQENQVIAAKNSSLQIKSVNRMKRVEQNTQSTEHDDDDDGDIDVQDYLFGRSSAPNAAVLEREALDRKTLSPTFSYAHERDLLDEAIEEIQGIGPASSFIEGIDSDPSSDNEDATVTAVGIPAWQMTFQCMHPHDGTEGENNPNSKTIEILGKMQAYYERTMDQWRAISYRKAISILKKTNEYIRTEEQAKAIPGIGERLAKKIAEIATTGELQRLENLDSSDHIVEIFMGIYGAGRSTALRWATQGLRTLQDVLERGNVTENQRVGIELYEDFSKRIPRNEVEEHATVVKEAAARIDESIEIYTMGSYRRGAETCGDIDLILTKPNATASDLMRLTVPLVDTLLASRFLTHCLATSHTEDGSKWHGVSRLPGGIHRRLDLLFVPWKERGAALIYFTGNDIFNRSLRLLASKKGMGLNQRGLFKDTMRGPGRVKLTRGTCIASESEQEIFDILGVPWRPPELRNC